MDLLHSGAPRRPPPAARLLAAAGFLAVAAAASPKIWPTETDDVPSKPYFTCGAWGEPHIMRKDGTSYQHAGLGEYTFLSLKESDIEINYYGCSIRANGTTADGYHGSFIGAIAIRIGIIVVEIVGNDVRITSDDGLGAMNYDVEWGKDHQTGPITVRAATLAPAPRSPR